MAQKMNHQKLCLNTFLCLYIPIFIAIGLLMFIVFVFFVAAAPV